MKIALAQMEVVPGKPRKTLERILGMVKDAKDRGADLVAFPEMVFGYLVGDRWLDDNFCNDLVNFNEDLRKASETHEIAIAYGNVFVEEAGEEHRPNKDGRSRKYNAVHVFQNGKPARRLHENDILPKGVQPKTLLPNYRIFDDERYFFSTQDVAKDFGTDLEDLLSPFVIEVDGTDVPVGFDVCEGAWCKDYRKDGEALNPTKILIENGAELMVNVSSSPWTYGKNDARDRRIEFLKQESGDDFVPFLYVNCVGAQNNGKNILTFDGGTTVYNSDGDPVAFSDRAYEEQLMIVSDSDLEGKVLKREEESMIAQKYGAIIQGVRHVKDIFGSDEQPRYVIGLSGGIDSAVVAALLVQAVGRDRVLAVNMPTKYNSDKTKKAAEHVARALGISYEVIPVGDLSESNQRILERIDADGSGKGLSTIEIENIQAKVRGTSILSNLAAKYNAIFTNNGNKVETALGYATLYGDVGGALTPIGDLTKTEVVAKAKYLNESVFDREIIPSELIPDELWRFGEDQIQPSAELRDNQVDPMKYGYHCALTEAFTDFKKKTPEDVMSWYLEGSLEENLGISSGLVERWGLEDPKTFVEDLEWFDSLIQRNVFKRIQSPPIIITSKSAYGYDIRESMLPYQTTLRQEELKERVLAMDKYLSGGKNE